MALDPKILSSVIKNKKGKALENKSEYAQRRQLLCQKYPELCEIYNELSRTMSSLSLSLFQNSDDSENIVSNIQAKNSALLKKRGELLEKYGFGHDYLTYKPLCPICEDSFYTNGKPCSCVVKECLALQNKELSSMLNIGENNFSKFRLDLYSDKSGDSNAVRENMKYIYYKCRDFAENFKNLYENLLFCGEPGLGKTFLCGCIAHDVSKSGFSVVYDTAVNIFSYFEQNKFGTVSEQLELQIKRISICDLLVIDDLGAEMHSSFNSAALYSLLNTRLLQKRPIIISTALSKAEIRNRYGAQIASRLFGEFSVFLFYGEDIRLKK